jgi:hypothetical protein
MKPGRAVTALTAIGASPMFHLLSERPENAILESRAVWFTTAGLGSPIRALRQSGRPVIWHAFCTGGCEVICVGAGTVSWLNGSRIKLAVRLGLARCVEARCRTCFCPITSPYCDNMAGHNLSSKNKASNSYRTSGPNDCKHRLPTTPPDRHLQLTDRDAEHGSDP